ncbi:response regulator [Pandoraea sputorum]|uniref:Transcriptional regulatory protein OmpR n=1 Tax=Pandoraea sputorum TaxID=93222 RepID=A0A239SIY1_9BURK|nr:response regulator [Pandoraea sputorum]AJC16979.1 DNA-binding response regulator [Pandoraea sputorum]SNU84828.1 Transcriptional regulatory protein OmpR [Pandoraea sputorum]VVD80299.1 DNA-binding response regulator [Pandoraea sputorum]
MAPARSVARLLVVDDDPQIRDLLSDYLRESGFDVATAADGVQMWAQLAAIPADVVVLDLMLPGEDGLSLCRQLHARGDVSVVMLTSRSTLFDRIVGLEVGADDYLPKPFDPRELLARIKAVLRRGPRLPPGSTQAVTSDRVMAARGVPVSSFPTLHHAQLQPSQAAYFDFDGWRLDTLARQLISPEGRVITLGGSDYRTLQALVMHPHRPLSRDFLLDCAFGRHGAANDRAIDVCVSRLRAHLDTRARPSPLIRTVRNEGYMLAADVVASHV